MKTANKDKHIHRDDFCPFYSFAVDSGLGRKKKEQRQLARSKQTDGWMMMTEKSRDKDDKKKDRPGASAKEKDRESTLATIKICCVETVRYQYM